MSDSKVPLVVAMPLAPWTYDLTFAICPASNCAAIGAESGKATCSAGKQPARLAGACTVDESPTSLANHLFNATVVTTR
eukprot:NODE_21977_length_728_cov_1.091514.p4 GENE.NODE_21977_length_728_cov_1.091514~~NODE_21977_length_728_cov_1.091514.p4  ORF type:complete len:79 (-),score=11.84 NODE_21977_length_728_cov_1.091514:131-367(-)